MSNKKSIDISQIKSSTIRSKKLPPPPLCLPASTTPTTDEDIVFTRTEQTEQNCSLSSSSKECSHQHIPYILPIGQRPQILETLINTSSSLLVQPSSESKPKRSQISFNTNQMNLLKQHQASRQGIVTDTEWLNLLRFIVYKPFENELQKLLDKYKTTYFDRVNSPNTSDAAIRAILCDMVSEILTTYSTNSSVLPNDIPANLPSYVGSSSTSSNGTSKRKRYDTNDDITTRTIDNQTKFVISYITPGKRDTIVNSNKITSQQQRRQQFQRKYTHLFKYVPDKDEQTYLIHQGHLKNPSTSSSSSSSSRSSHNQTNNACLMLYDEVLAYIDEDDLKLSGISIENCFTLSESMLTHIHYSIQ